MIRQTSLSRFVINISICIWLAGAILMAAGCTTNGDKNVGPVEVTLSPSGDDAGIADVMEVLDWINVRTDSMSYIGAVKKIEFSASDFFIFEHAVNDCILRFSGDGQFVAKIGQKGNGPGEYTHIYDFAVNEKTRSVAILGDNSEIYLYDFDGKFLRKEKLSGGFIGSIAFCHDSLIGSSDFAGYDEDGLNHLLYRFGEDYKIQGEWIGYERPKTAPYSSIINQRLISMPGYVYYIDNEDMSIYRYDSKADDARMYINFETAHPMPAAMYLDMMEFMQHQLEYTWIKDVIITDSKIAVGYIDNGKYCMALLDSDGVKLKDVGFPYSLPEISTSDGDIIYSAISAHRYLDFWKDVPNIKKPAFNINEETDMVLMKWRLRPNHDINKRQ